VRSESRAANTSRGRRRLFLRWIARAATPASLAVAVGLSGAGLAAALRGAIVPWPVFWVAIALQVALLARAGQLTIRQLRAMSGTTTPRTIGYLESPAG
jgi:hypothetical protein